MTKREDEENQERERGRREGEGKWTSVSPSAPAPQKKENKETFNTMQHLPDDILQDCIGGHLLETHGMAFGLMSRTSKRHYRLLKPRLHYAKHKFRFSSTEIVIPAYAQGVHSEIASDGTMSWYYLTDVFTSLHGSDGAWRWRLKVYPSGRKRSHYVEDKAYMSAYMVPVESNAMVRSVNMRMETIADYGEDHATTKYSNNAVFLKEEDGSWSDWGFRVLAVRPIAEPRKDTTLIVHLDRFFVSTKM